MLEIFDLLNIFILTDLLNQFTDLVNSNLWFILICEIIVLLPIVLMSKRLGDKVLKGLQGGVATIIIGRGVYDAYNSLNNNSSSTGSGENNSTGNDNKSDNNKSDNNKSDNNKSDNNKKNNINNNTNNTEKQTK